MPLNSTQEALLSICAEHMAAGTEPPSELDLFHAFYRDTPMVHDDMVAYLAGRVQHLTQGRRTVRRIDPTLVEAGWTALYVVVCNIDSGGESPTHVVTERTIGMLPYHLKTDTHGFRREEWVNPAETARRRAEREAGQHRNHLEEEGKQSLAEFTAWLHQKVLTLMGGANDAKREDAKQVLGHTQPTMEQLAAACIALGSSVKDVVDHFVREEA